jgi:outer membrane protein assembly factor BamA
MEPDSSELLKCFAAADVGIGFIARSNIDQEIRAKALAAISLADTQVRSDPALVFPEDKSFSRAAKAFMEIAVRQKEVFRGWGWEAIQITALALKSLAPCLLCLCLLEPGALAQKKVPSNKATAVETTKLVALKVAGTERYSDKEILAASGLQIGQPAADGDFKEAAQRLGDSGLFSGVVYSFTSSGDTVKLELQLADTDKGKLVPAQFDNFVWFTDNELRAALQRRVPLFKQLVPLSGNLMDRVSEALQAILSEKGLPGRVDYVREGQDESGGPLVGVAYRVEEVSIRIHDFEFPGASPEQTTLLKAAVHRAIGGKYERSAVAAVAKFDLLPVYLQRGFLQAAFGPSDARVVTQSPSVADDQGPSELHSELEVDAIVPVVTGKVYLTSGVDWKGNTAITTSTLAPLVQLPTGVPADAVRLPTDLEKVEKLYRSRGYMAIQIKPNPEFDEKRSTVHYDLDVVEGDLYRMGELEIIGLDTQAKARMVEAWALRQGQPYNAEYSMKFLGDNRQLIPRGVQGTIQETPDAKDKTVDVEIRFKPQ